MSNLPDKSNPYYVPSVTHGKHVGWFTTVGNRLHFIYGTDDPRIVHDNGKPYFKAIAVSPDHE